MHIQGNPVEIQTPTQWKLIIGRMTTPVCYRPAVFVNRLRLIALPVQHGKFRSKFKNFIISNFRTFLKSFPNLKLHNLKLPNLGCVFTRFIWPAPIKTIFILEFLCNSSAANHWSGDNTAP
jgi:hypothetical protein